MFHVKSKFTTYNYISHMSIPGASLVIHNTTFKNTFLVVMILPCQLLSTYIYLLQVLQLNTNMLQECYGPATSMLQKCNGSAISMLHECYGSATSMIQECVDAGKVPLSRRGRFQMVSPKIDSFSFGIDSLMRFDSLIANHKDFLYLHRGL